MNSRVINSQQKHVYPTTNIQPQYYSNNVEQHQQFTTEVKIPYSSNKVNDLTLFETNQLSNKVNKKRYNTPTPRRPDTNRRELNLRSKSRDRVRSANNKKEIKTHENFPVKGVVNKLVPQACVYQAERYISKSPRIPKRPNNVERRFVKSFFDNSDKRTENDQKSQREKSAELVKKAQKMKNIVLFHLQLIQFSNRIVLKKPNY